MEGHSDYLPGTIDFLARFGVRITYADAECETVEIEARDISAEELVAALREYETSLKRRLYFRRQRALSVCVGGPCNGRRHDFPGSFRRGKGEVVTFHLSRAKWAVYEVGEDRRAWFRGIATSRKKARRLEVIKPDAAPGATND